MVTANCLKNLKIEDLDDYNVAEQLIEYFNNRKLERVPFYLDFEDFDKILKWKLGSQYGRSNRIRELNTNEIIEQITKLALNLSHKDIDYELELRINLLCSIRGVGVPVASAILALIYPNKYGVIDFRNWRQIFGEERSGFSVNDYKKYIRKIEELAKELRWSIQQVDWHIWEYDRIVNRLEDGL